MIYRATINDQEVTAEPFYYKPKGLYGDEFRRFGFKINFPNAEQAHLFPNPIITCPEHSVETAAQRYISSLGFQ